MEPDRGLADTLDEVEDVGALLVAHGVAEDAAKQADVIAQPGVFLQRQIFKNPGLFSSLGVDLGFGRHGLGRHWLYSRGCPADVECASFLPQCKMKMEACHSSRCHSGARVSIGPE